MPESPRRLELRLSVPADPMYREVATGLAAKLAEHLGCAEDRVSKIGAAVERTLDQVSGGKSADAHIDLTLEATPAALTIRATNGAHRAETTCPLSD
jgi:hypothetical protein